MSQETIRLHNLQGFARKSGTDDSGNAWIEFELDAYAIDCDCDGPECDPDVCPRLGTECSICGDRIESGWLCLDGGDEVCDRHVQCEPWSDEGVAGRPTRPE